MQQAEVYNYVLNSVEQNKSILIKDHPELTDKILWNIFYNLVLVDLIKGLDDLEVTDKYLELQQQLGLDFSPDLVEKLAIQHGVSEQLKSVKLVNGQQSSLNEPQNPSLSNYFMVQEQALKVLCQTNEQVRISLLNRLQDIDPVVFEGLMMQLFIKMGYQRHEGHHIATPTTHDFGIDGIINYDPLGTRQLYFQAKRYAPEHHVQRPEVDAFNGALARQQVEHGVFITTSDFTSGAKKAYAERNKITLVNGEELSRLLVQYELGVSSRSDVKVLELDEMGLV